MTIQLDDLIKQAIREEIEASRQRGMFDPTRVRDAALVMGQVHVVDTIDQFQSQVNLLSRRNAALLAAFRHPDFLGWLGRYPLGSRVRRNEMVGQVGNCLVRERTTHDTTFEVALSVTYRHQQWNQTDYIVFGEEKPRWEPWSEADVDPGYLWTPWAPEEE